jgi:hypothetical protein
MMRARRLGLLTFAMTLVTAVASCGESLPPHLYLPTKSYSITIIPSLSPPHAREPILYKIVILDRITGQPIENGEGQIFANTREGQSTYDGFTYGPEVGTYYGKLNYVVAGLWAEAIRFRRDSLHPLERVDWMQDVLNERPDSVSR